MLPDERLTAAPFDYPTGLRGQPLEERDNSLGLAAQLDVQAAQIRLCSEKEPDEEAVALEVALLSCGLLLQVMSKSLGEFDPAGPHHGDLLGAAWLAVELDIRKGRRNGL